MSTQVRTQLDLEEAVERAASGKRDSEKMRQPIEELRQTREDTP
jgi:hypothetical protein